MSPSSRTAKPLAYFGMPVVFCVLGYALLWLALQPVWPVVSATVGFLVSKEAPSFSNNLSVVYDPEALKEEAEAGFIPGESVKFPTAGDLYGQVTCARIGLDVPVYWHDTDEILDYGAGQSLTSFPPGFGRSIVLSGHNMTYFNCLQDIAVGDVIEFDTNWCNYEYTVTRVEVYNENALWDYINENMFREEEELVMYTCYPFYAITGRKTDRLTVFAERTSGLDVKWRETDEV